MSPTGRVLLLRLEPTFRAPFWVTPGGGRDEGESFGAAALRELREEVGRDDLELGPWIWTRSVEFTWEDRRIRQLERTYFVTAPTEFEPVVVDAGIEPIVGGRWLTQEEIASLPEVVYPNDLGDLIARLIENGPPPEPIDLASSSSEDRRRWVQLASDEGLTAGSQPPPRTPSDPWSMFETNDVEVCDEGRTGHQNDQANAPSSRQAREARHAVRKPGRIGRLHRHPGGQGNCGNERRRRLHFVVIVEPVIDVRLLDELDDGYGPVFELGVGRRIDEHVVGDGDHLLRWQLNSVSRRWGPRPTSSWPVILACSGWPGRGSKSSSDGGAASSLRARSASSTRTAVLHIECRRTPSSW
jgi:8-oxo-dGTP pyrophosphatase MutT (NUDIX family)